MLHRKADRRGLLVHELLPQPGARLPGGEQRALGLLQHLVVVLVAVLDKYYATGVY